MLVTKIIVIVATCSNVISHFLQISGRWTWSDATNTLEYLG